MMEHEISTMKKEKKMENSISIADVAASLAILFAYEDQGTVEAVVATIIKGWCFINKADIFDFLESLTIGINDVEGGGEFESHIIRANETTQNH